MNNEQTIWQYLWEHIGNAYGAAGLMGNLQAESALIPNNLENSFARASGWTDETYTAAVDNGSYTRDMFTGDNAGYGLAQWTYWSRKRDLYDLAKKRGASIADLEMQLDYLWAELGQYKPVLTTLVNAQSVREASDAVLLEFEKPADLSEKNQLSRCRRGEVFYAKYATEGGESIRKSEIVLNPAAQAVIDLAATKIGDPYVFGTWGQPCTPDIRKRYAGYNPQYKERIYSECPKLSGRQSSCTGCKWDGHLCYDCRGFVHYVLKNAAGIDLYGEGCTTQWEHRDNWSIKGETQDLPNLVCVLYKRNGSKMSHTGIHIGDGQIIHCTGNGGVKRGSVSDSGWTHFAIPAGLYSGEEIQKAGDVVVMDTIKKGSSGLAVVYLQKALNKLGFECGTADGIFGSKTELAVRALQSAYNIKADGIVGPETWALLESALDSVAINEQDEPQKQEQTAPDIEITIKLTREHMQSALDSGRLIIDCRSGNVTNIDYQ